MAQLPFYNIEILPIIVSPKMCTGCLADVCSVYVCVYAILFVCDFFLLCLCFYSFWSVYANARTSLWYIHRWHKHLSWALCRCRVARSNAQKWEPHTYTHNIHKMNNVHTLRKCVYSLNTVHIMIMMMTTTNSVVHWMETRCNVITCQKNSIPIKINRTRTTK